MSGLDEPEWLESDAVVQLHDMSVANHGGLHGVRDAGALASALARPQNKWSYGEEDLIMLAAAYGFGLARNHAFADGNKRIAYIATELFLDLNGWAIEATDADKIQTFLALAAGEIDEDGLAAWLRERAVPPRAATPSSA